MDDFMEARRLWLPEIDINTIVLLLCVILPSMSLVWNLGCRVNHTVQRLSRASSGGVRTGGDDIEGGSDLKRAASKGTDAQREADRKEEEAIKRRASEKMNGS